MSPTILENGSVLLENLEDPHIKTLHKNSGQKLLMYPIHKHIFLLVCVCGV